MSPRLLPETPRFEAAAEEAVWTALRADRAGDLRLCRATSGGGRLQGAGEHPRRPQGGRPMAIYTPMQVPQPITDSHVVRPAPTPRRVHTRATHRLGLALDITLAVIAGAVILLMIF